MSSNGRQVSIRCMKLERCGFKHIKIFELKKDRHVATIMTIWLINAKIFFNEIKTHEYHIDFSFRVAFTGSIFIQVLVDL